VSRKLVHKPFGANDTGRAPVRGAAQTAARNAPQLSAAHDQLLNLQRTVGNRATQQALAAPTLQRALATRASDLDQAFGKGGALAANLDRGTFAAIRRTLASYQRLHDPADQLDALQTLSKLVSKWMVEHKGKGATDMQRRQMLERLEGEIADESVRLSKAAADDKYVDNVHNSREGGNGDKHAFKALTQDSKVRMWEPPQMKAGRAFGLSDGEITAIQIFTGNDYGYINPATKVDEAWYQGNKNRERTKAAFTEGASDKTTKAEGRVHAGMAIQGLRKLPAYGADVYRGLAFTAAEFRKDVPSGGLYNVPTIASASKSRKTAEGFAGTGSKEIAVIMIMHRAGGREIQKISLASTESEVTLMPRKYSVLSITPIAMLPTAESYVTACYEVHVTG
jgi:hypothetical protein